MQQFPHHYSVVAKADTQGDVALQGERLPPIASAPPTEFGGPGDRWSPETLFVAAVADCFVLTFRGIASLSRFPWVSLECNVTGAVDRVDRVTQFTALDVRARLRVPSGAKEDQARRLLMKAEETCLVTNSLKVRPRLESVVEVEKPKTVIFACVHNAGRSQMAAAFFNKLADPAKARALSAGTTPGDRVHPEVVAVMREEGIDLSGARPQKLTAELAAEAQLLITMGCGDECPYVPGVRRDDWPLDDPKGQPVERIRAIRDDIRARVEALVVQEDAR
jgi:arsenate reductase